MVVPMEQWAGQPFQDESADLWVVMLSDHNEKYSDRMERSYKAFAVTFELSFLFPLTLARTQTPSTVFPKSRQHVCFVRRRIQMSDVEVVKIISIWCLSVQFGRRSMKSIREDCIHEQW